MLGVLITINEGIPLISLRGRFDGLGANIFDQEIETHIQTERQWVVDFSEVTYLSSAGIRSLIKYGKQLLKVEGELTITGLTHDVKTVLDTTGVLPLFRVTDSVDEAFTRINRKQESASTGQSFTALGRDCYLKLLSEEKCCLDIWNPLNYGTMQDLNSGNLIAASLDELNIAFGIGALGAQRTDALETLGSFITVEKLAGFLPADGYNQADFLLVNKAQEANMYIAAAVGFSGEPWGSLDLPAGLPVSILDIQKLIFAKLQEVGKQSTGLIGLLMLANVQSGNGHFYQKFEDMIQNKLQNRVLAENQTIMLVGLAGNADWETNEGLAAVLRQEGIKAGEEFFIGNGLLFSKLLDWNNIKEPAQMLDCCSDLDILQDVFVADAKTAISGGRVWLFVPELVRSGKEKQLQIEIIGQEEIPEEWEIITRRLYAEASKVILEPLHGGFSPSKPFRVAAYDNANRRMLPTVIKLGPHKSVESEIINHQKYVHNYLLNNSTTIMGTSRYGQSTGMRYNFVGISGPDSNLTWLTNRFRERPVEELIPLFDDIFTHILKPWYGQPRWERIRPYQEHNPLINFPDLFRVAEQEFGISAEQPSIDCLELGITLPNPFHFLKNEYPARASQSQLWYTGINHGDLNMQNILLDERDNVYIIDFSDTRPRNIVSDFARLEPIFKFEMTRLESEQDLTTFLELERALAQVSSLDEQLPFVYNGDDPAVEKVYQMICQIRRYAKTVVIFETDIIPYLLAMLEWTYPVIIYRQTTPQGKKMAIYSAALIVQQILRLESQD